MSVIITRPDAPPRKDDDGMERTESGLVVPKGTVEKHRKTILLELAKRMDRMAKALVPEGLMMMFMCIECGTPAMPARDEHSTWMECKCTRRIIR